MRALAEANGYTTQLEKVLANPGSTAGRPPGGEDSPIAHTPLKVIPSVDTRTGIAEALTHTPPRMAPLVDSQQDTCITPTPVRVEQAPTSQSRDSDDMMCTTRAATADPIAPVLTVSAAPETIEAQSASAGSSRPAATTGNIENEELVATQELDDANVDEVMADHTAPPKPQELPLLAPPVCAEGIQAHKPEGAVCDAEPAFEATQEMETDLTGSEAVPETQLSWTASNGTLATPLPETEGTSTASGSSTRVEPPMLSSLFTRTPSSTSAIAGEGQQPTLPKLGKRSSSYGARLLRAMGAPAETDAASGVCD